MLRLQRLNHAFLYVRDLDRAIAFYCDVLGMRVVARMGENMAFLQASASDNHHDLGLASVGAAAPIPEPGSTGLYHLAWEVGTIEEVAKAKDVLAAAEALLRTTDHGISKSVYGQDPDGNQFEITWVVPRASWEAGAANVALSRPMNIEREIERFGQSNHLR